MEMRWPGAKWGEVRTVRGQTPISKPLALLEAADAIQRQTPETLAKPEWLHLRVQSQILTGSIPESLIGELRETEQRKQERSLMLDLAIVDFRMGGVTQKTEYYREAKMILDKILEQYPSDSVALFNRAIIEERLNLREAAIADFTASQKFEKDPSWSDEIRQRIARLSP